MRHEVGRRGVERADLDLRLALLHLEKPGAAFRAEMPALPLLRFAGRLEGGFGGDTVRAGAGDDSVFGGNGDDLLLGDSGFDWLSGGAGHDDLDGGSDDDTIRGGAGDDDIFGADVLQALADNNRFDSGSNSNHAGV